MILMISEELYPLYDLGSPGLGAMNTNIKDDHNESKKNIY
jgi:hypothetical protein